MEHPFINNLDALSLEELQTKLSDLTGKLAFAQRMGNGPLVNQINMALESYRSAHAKKTNELMQKVTGVIKVENTNGSNN